MYGFLWSRELKLLATSWCSHRTRLRTALEPSCLFQEDPFYFPFGAFRPVVAMMLTIKESLSISCHPYAEFPSFKVISTTDDI